MIIDFSKIMSVSRKTFEFDVPIEADAFSTDSFRYEYADKKPVKFFLTSPDKGILQIKAVIDVTLNIPCDRCLENVKTGIFVETSRKINFSSDEAYNDSYEKPEDYKAYISGTDLDAEKFVRGEILMNLPMKILCSEDCKGICNIGTDTIESDNPMAKAIEIFNSFKEV